MSEISIPAFDIKEPFSGFEKDGFVHLWITSRLWELSKNLTNFEYEVKSFNSLDEDVWFNSQHKPTINKVLEHYKKIEKANFDYPIILSQDGIVLDGVHRICRAILDGKETIPAVKFDLDPVPDHKQKV